MLAVVAIDLLSCSRLVRLYCSLVTGINIRLVIAGFDLLFCSSRLYFSLVTSLMIFQTYLKQYFLFTSRLAYARRERVFSQTQLLQDLLLSQPLEQ